MIKKTRSLLVAAIALVALSAMASTAMANHTLNSSPGGAITATSLGDVTFDSSLSDVTCPLTMTGSLNTSGNNSAGESIGSTSEVEIGTCSGADNVVVLGLPWDMQLTAAWTGPTNAVSFTIVGAEYDLQGVFGSLECLYTGNANASVSTDRNGVTGLVTSSANSINRATGESGFCPSSGRLVGSFSQTTQTLSLS